MADLRQRQVQYFTQFAKLSNFLNLVTIFGINMINTNIPNIDLVFAKQILKFKNFVKTNGSYA